MERRRTLRSMDVDGARTLLLSLPHVVETMQWGDNLVFWVGDKALGGKMFALADLDGRMGLVISFAAGPQGFAELCEREGLRPAPYFARLHWVAAERWDALTSREWQHYLSNAHDLVQAKLSQKVHRLLELPAKERASMIAAKRKELAVALQQKQQAQGETRRRSPRQG